MEVSPKRGANGKGSLNERQLFGVGLVVGGWSVDDDSLTLTARSACPKRDDSNFRSGSSRDDADASSNVRFAQRHLLSGLCFFVLDVDRHINWTEYRHAAIRA